MLGKNEVPQLVRRRIYLRPSNQAHWRCYSETSLSLLNPALIGKNGWNLANLPVSPFLTKFPSNTLRLLHWMNGWPFGVFCHPGEMKPCSLDGDLTPWVCGVWDWCPGHGLPLAGCSVFLASILFPSTFPCIYALLVPLGLGRSWLLHLGLVQLIYYDNVCLWTGVFDPFTFALIIDINLDLILLS